LVSFSKGKWVLDAIEHQSEFLGLKFSMRRGRRPSKSNNYISYERRTKEYKVEY
jgi:hypothetical protein